MSEQENVARDGGCLCHFHGPERNYYVEAQMILKGLEGIEIQWYHLEAMQEFHECSLIRIANRLDETKKTILEMP